MTDTRSAQGPLVIVIGPPGAGKSRLGKQVAKLLRVDFVDTDRRVVAKHGPIPNIFFEHGEEWFRAVERIEVQKALKEPAVIALGGGAILDRDTQSDLEKQRVALVTVSPDVVQERLGGTVRPLLRDGVESWKQLVDERREIYKRLASRVWDSSGRSVKELATEIAEWVKVSETHCAVKSSQERGQE